MNQSQSPGIRVIESGLLNVLKDLKVLKILKILIDDACGGRVSTAAIMGDEPAIHLLLRSNLAYRIKLAEPRSLLQARSVFIGKPLVSHSVA
jgi:hypothetical protein